MCLASFWFSPSNFNQNNANANVWRVIPAGEMNDLGNVGNTNGVRADSC